ncbi:MAG TPA: DNA recombination protein RmuC [Pseudomonadales bacterium]
MPERLILLLRHLEDPWLLAAFAAGVAGASLLWGWRLRVRVRRVAQEAVDATLAREELRHQADLARLEQQLDERDRYLAVVQGEARRLEAELDTVRDELRERVEQLTVRRESEAALRTRLEENQRHFAEKEAALREHGETLKRELELLANRIFQHQGEQHQARLTALLAPFRDQLDDFRKRVETVYSSDTRERATLLNEVRNLQKSSERMNKEAEHLARALKGDVKLQGNWGELVLERVLEASGLRAGEEYLVQVARRDGAGSLKRPDVLIRLPDEKHVVVDAKLSLVAYERALAAENEASREQWLRQHVASLRGHVKRLAEQDYDRLSDLRSLDFVLLFVPVEAAFTLAMQHDPRLFTDAFERRIVIVGPSTLMMTLRIIHNVWRYEKQNRNAQEIARRAGALYDKLRGFVEDLETVGRQLQGAEAAYQAALGKLSTGRGNLLRRAEELRELGAPVKKPLPAHLLGDEDEADGSDTADSRAPAPRQNHGAA